MCVSRCYTWHGIAPEVWAAFQSVFTPGILSRLRAAQCGARGADLGCTMRHHRGAGLGATFSRALDVAEPGILITSTVGFRLHDALLKNPSPRLVSTTTRRPHDFARSAACGDGQDAEVLEPSCSAFAQPRPPFDLESVPGEEGVKIQNSRPRWAPLCARFVDMRMQPCGMASRPSSTSEGGREHPGGPSVRPADYEGAKSGSSEASDKRCTAHTFSD